MTDGDYTKNTIRRVQIDSTFKDYGGAAGTAYYSLGVSAMITNIAANSHYIVRQTKESSIVKAFVV